MAAAFRHAALQTYSRAVRIGHHSGIYHLLMLTSITVMLLFRHPLPLLEYSTDRLDHEMERSRFGSDTATPDWQQTTPRSQTVSQSHNPRNSVCPSLVQLHSQSYGVRTNQEHHSTPQCTQGCSSRAVAQQLQTQHSSALTRRRLMPHESSYARGGAAKMSDAFVPPNPNELDITALIGRCTAELAGMKLP